MSRSSHKRCYVEKSWWVMTSSFIKRRLQHRCFSVNIAQFVIFAEKPISRLPLSSWLWQWNWILVRKEKILYVFVIWMVRVIYIYTYKYIYIHIYYILYIYIYIYIYMGFWKRYHSFIYLFIYFHSSDWPTDRRDEENSN